MVAIPAGMECWLKRAVGTLGLLSLLAATPVWAVPLAGFALRAETHNFAFFSRGDARVDVRRPEAQLARIETALGQRLSARVDYYIYERAEDIAATTGRYAGGLTFPDLGQIHSTSSSQDHEIVHVVAFQLGDPGPFFQEGLAVALGDHGRWLGQPVDRVARKAAQATTLEALISHFDAADPKEGYAVAGSFMSFLIKTHGLPQVSHFFRACHGGRTAAAAFTAIFGETLELAGARWVRTL
jgi:hypothetical protein